MGTRLVLVRHCQTRVEPERPASTWVLTERGTADAQRLCTLPEFVDVAAIAVGNQPKLSESIAPLAATATIPIISDPDLRESDGQGWFEVEFRGVIERFFAHPSVPPAPGWESAQAAATRFARAQARLLARCTSGGSVVICSGGRVLTAALGAMALVAPEDLFDTWTKIRMPDVASVEFAPDGTPTLVGGFGENHLL